MSEENIQQQATGAAAVALNPATLTQPLASAKIWIQLLAIVAILEGVGLALSVVGLVVAWLPIWYGVECWRAASGVDAVLQRNESAAMAEMYRHLHKSFMLLGVYVLLLLAAGLVGFVGAFVLGNLQVPQV